MWLNLRVYQRYTMKLGRWTSGILLGRWMSVIFLGPKMESHEDMWNPLCFHGTGLHLPTRRRRWQSVKGIQVWNPKKHSHSCSSWQLPMVAVHAGPRHLLGIMVLWCYSLFFRDLLFCGSGIILWFWHSLFLKIRKRKRLTSVNLVQMLIVVWGRGVCVYWGRGKKTL